MRENNYCIVAVVVVVAMVLWTSVAYATVGVPRQVYEETAGKPLLDSIVHVNVDGSTYGFKKVYTYDSEGRVTQEVEYARKSYAVWALNKVTSCAYDNRGREILREVTRYDDQSIMSGSKFATEYADEENKIIIFEYSKSEEEDWMLCEQTEKQMNSIDQISYININNIGGWGYKYFYDYTEEGKNKTLEVYHKGANDADYSLWLTCEWSYNGNSGARIERMWNKKSEELENRLKTDFKLNNQGDTLQTTLYVWSFTNDDQKDWKAYERYVYKYDSQNRVVSCGYYEPGRLTWVETMRDEYVYGQYGIERYIISTLNDEYMMEPVFVDVYSYNASGLLDYIEFYIKDSEIEDFSLFAEERNYYGKSGLVSPIVGTVRLAGLTLDLGEAQQAVVYTVDGRMVYSGWCESVELPAPGLYIVKTAGGSIKVLAR